MVDLSGLKIGDFGSSGSELRAQLNEQNASLEEHIEAMREDPHAALAATKLLVRELSEEIMRLRHMLAETGRAGAPVQLCCSYHAQLCCLVPW